MTIRKWYSQLEIRIYTCDINTVSDIKYTKVHEKTFNSKIANIKMHI